MGSCHEYLTVRSDQVIMVLTVYLVVTVTMNRRQVAA